MRYVESLGKQVVFFFCNFYTRYQVLLLPCIMGRPNLNQSFYKMSLGLIEAIITKVFIVPQRNSTAAIVLGNTRAILKTGYVCWTLKNLSCVVCSVIRNFKSSTNVSSIQSWLDVWKEHFLSVLKGPLRKWVCWVLICG